MNFEHSHGMPDCVGPGAVAHVLVGGMLLVLWIMEASSGEVEDATQYQSLVAKDWQLSPTPGLSL